MTGIAIIIVIIASIIAIIRSVERISNNPNSKDDIFRSFRRNNNHTIDYEQAKRERKKQMLLDLKSWENNEANMSVGNALERDGFDVSYEVDRSIDYQLEDKIEYPKKSTMELPDWIKDERKKMGKRIEAHSKKRIENSLSQVEAKGIMGVPDWVMAGKQKRGNMGQNEEPKIIWKTYNIEDSKSPESVEKVRPIKEKISHIEVRDRQASLDLDTVKDAVSKMVESEKDQEVVVSHTKYHVDEDRSQNQKLEEAPEPTLQTSSNDDHSTPEEIAIHSTETTPEKGFAQSDEKSIEEQSTVSEKVEVEAELNEPVAKYTKTGKYDNLGSEEKLLAWVDDFANKNIFIKFGFFDNKFDIPKEFSAEFKGDDNKIEELVTLLKKGGLLTSVDDGEIFAYPFKKRIVLTSIGRERLGNYK